MSSTAAAFLGAIIGSAASLLGLLIQQRYQNKRERLRIAADLAMKDHQQDMELAKNTEGGGAVAPISVYVIYHARLLEELAKSKVTSEKIKELTKERDEILAAFPGAPDEGTNSV